MICNCPNNSGAEFCLESISRGLRNTDSVVFRSLFGEGEAPLPGKDKQREVVGSILPTSSPEFGAALLQNVANAEGRANGRNTWGTNCSEPVGLSGFQLSCFNRWEESTSQELESSCTLPSVEMETETSLLLLS